MPSQAAPKRSWVADPAAVNVRRGSVVNVWTGGTVVYIVPVQGQGPDFVVDEESFDFSGSSFRISGVLRMDAAAIDDGVAP